MVPIRHIAASPNTALATQDDKTPNFPIRCAALAEASTRVAQQSFTQHYRQSSIASYESSVCAATQQVWEASSLSLLSLQVHDDPQCRIDTAHLVESESSDVLAESAWVNGRGLLG
jgi:hypothetical protein